MGKHQHIADWEKVGRIKAYSEREKSEKRLVGQWMDRVWQTVVFGQLVQGELCQVDYPCDVIFTLEVPHGNKTLHIKGPYEEFFPVEQKEGG
jgi:hypothetical protein